jgi:transposase-like protein
VQAFLSRPLREAGYAYVDLDATYLKARLGTALQVCSRAVVVAMGVNADGRRELLGIQVGDSASEAFWAAFITSRKERGLAGLRQVISDAHVGLNQAIRQQLQGCVWQRRTERCAWLLSSRPFRSQPAAACAQGPPGHGHGRAAQRVCPRERCRNPQPLG